jgi:hypothetical protein
MIKFRAKPINLLDKIPFIYGFLGVNDIGGNCIKYKFRWVKVDKNSIGQFTGKLDKTGKEIFGSIIIDDRLTSGGDIVNGGIYMVLMV